MKVYKCPTCGKEITKLGVVCKQLYHLYRDGEWSDEGEIGEVEEYYCTECGATLTKELGDKIRDIFEEGE